MQQLGVDLLLFNTAADSEDVSVRMSHMHFANIPGHVGWRPGDVKILGEAPLVYLIDDANVGISRAARASKN